MVVKHIKLIYTYQVVVRSEDKFPEMVTNGNDNTNMMIWRLGSRNQPQYIATGESLMVHEIDMDTLDVIEAKVFDQKTLATSSHWRRDIGANSSINFHIIDNGNGGVNFTLFRFNETYEVLLNSMNS